MDARNSGMIKNSRFNTISMIAVLPYDGTGLALSFPRGLPLIGTRTRGNDALETRSDPCALEVYDACLMSIRRRYKALL